MLGSDENRNFMRMSVNADAQLILEDEQHGQQVIDAICLDLSATGASLQIKQPLEEGRELTILIESGGNVPALKALAQVVRSQRLDEGDYQLGCKITKIL